MLNHVRWPIFVSWVIRISTLDVRQHVRLGVGEVLVADPASDLDDADEVSSDVLHRQALNEDELDPWWRDGDVRRDGLAHPERRPGHLDFDPRRVIRGPSLWRDGRGMVVGCVWTETDLERTDPRDAKLR
jgi:hypothetical protein